MQLETNNFEKEAFRVSWVSIIWNVILSAFKLIAGVVAHSSAMISDAIHSASDVFSTLIVMVGIKISSKEADDSHQYGHERFECIAAVVLATVLFGTGCGIGYSGILVIIGRSNAPLLVPGVLALVAAAVSIIVKEAMYWYTRKIAKKYASTALMADAWHHRSDALSSVGSFIGILGARMGFPILDPLASVLISVFILQAAYEIFMESVGKLVDKSCDKETVDTIEALIKSQPGVEGIDMMRTRLFGSKIFVDVIILVNSDVTMLVSHHISNNVQQAVQKEIEYVKNCMVHVHPYTQQ